MKRFFSLAISLIMCLGACASAEMEIVCSLFPQYDFTRCIAGNHARVTQLLPNGVDSHGFEPSMRNMLNTDAADLFIYTDSELEGWVETFVKGLSNVKVVRCADGIDLESIHDEWEARESHSHDLAGDHSHTYDAHIWLDPMLAAQMCENIAQSLMEADPEHKEEYRKNADLYIDELMKLDAEFQALFAGYPDAEFFFGGKFAYSHFLRRYDLNYVTAYQTCSDEGEPSVRTIVNMADRMRQQGAKVIFTDEMSSGQIAQSLADQTGAKVLTFHTCHNLSKDDAAAGKTYLAIMRQNLEYLREALS